MPHHDRHRDELRTRDRSDMTDRGSDKFEDRDRGAFFERDRGERGDRSERGFGPDDDRSEIPRDETERLIASNKVEGTPVFDRHGERLGAIHNFMVDKFRGQVLYAVLRHSSGFLGLDDRFYPLDWDQLTYDTRLGGYHIDLTEDQLKNRGSWDRNQRWQGRGSMERGSAGRDGDFERGRSGGDRERTRDRW